MQILELRLRDGVVVAVAVELDGDDGRACRQRAEQAARPQQHAARLEEEEDVAREERLVALGVAVVGALGVEEDGAAERREEGALRWRRRSSSTRVARVLADPPFESLGGSQERGTMGRRQSRCAVPLRESGVRRAANAAEHQP